MQDEQRPTKDEQTARKDEPKPDETPRKDTPAKEAKQELDRQLDTGEENPG